MTPPKRGRPRPSPPVDPAPPVNGSPRSAIEHCPIAATVGALGDVWSILVLRELFLGVKRFNDMQKDLGISRSVLSDRLARLQELGVVRTQPYQEPGDRLRHEYRLTRKGVGLLPVIVALKDWGDEHISGVESLRLCDRETGEDVQLEFRTPSGKQVAANELVTMPGRP